MQPLAPNNSGTFPYPTGYSQTGVTTTPVATPVAMPMVSVKPKISSSPYHDPTLSTEENSRLWDTAYKEWVASTP